MNKQQDAAGATGDLKGIVGMGYLIKLIFLLLVLGFAGLVGYAYLVDLAPQAQEVRLPVVLHGE